MSDSPLTSQFAAAVRKRRSSLGLSQEQLSLRSGLHRTYIAGIERGARNLTLKSVARLAQALEVSVGRLLSFEPEQPTGAAEGGVAALDRDFVEILLVEDNPEDVELTLRAFELARFTNRTHVVRDGAEALDFLFCTGAYASRKREEHPRLILLDLNLPKVHGIEILRRIKADPQLQKIPVVVLTASSEDADIARTIDLGAEAYLVKPVGFDNLSKVTPQLSFRWALLEGNAPARVG